MTAMQHVAMKEGNALMNADLAKIRHNSAHSPGGGPHTLVCKNCKKPFEWHEVITGSRNRNDELVWTESNPSNFRYKLEYWHEDCNFPKGRYANVPTVNTTLPQQVIVGGNNNTGWNRAPASAKIEATTTTTDTATTSEADMIAKIVAAIQGHILPQLEAVTDSLEAKIDANNTTTHRIIAELANNVADLTGSLAIRIASLEAMQIKPLQIIIANDTANHPVDVGMYHHNLPRLVRLLKSLHPERRNVWLTGPAGSGKTTAAKQVAKALGMPDRYFFNGSIDTEYKLAGFVDANGNIVSTAFRECWTNGGVYLFDECDSSMPGALLAFNGALANGNAPFPGTLHPVPRHADCYIIAAANTWGFGGDSNYVGRAKLDGAFLSRFIRIPWDYDEALERAISGSAPAANLTLVWECKTRATPATEYDLTQWVNTVRTVREAAASQGAMFLITPRDSLNGADLLRAGYTNADVVEEIFGYIKRQDEDTWRTIGRAAIAYAANAA